MLNYILYFILITSVGILIDKYRKKQAVNKQVEYNNLVEKYLVNDETEVVNNPKKTIVWIYIPKARNARNWINFGSRNNYSNPPIMYITLTSIILKAQRNCKVCIVDDTSLSKLLKGWDIKLDTLDCFSKSKIANLAMMKVLYKYGGILVPPTYLAMNDIDVLYKNGVKQTDMFVVETLDDTKEYLTLNHMFVGCKAKSVIMKDIIGRLQQTAHDTALDDVFNEDSVLYSYIQDGTVTVVHGSNIGNIDSNGDLLSFDRLLSDEDICMDDNILHGIYIPYKKLLGRDKYRWILYLTYDDLLQTDTFLTRCMLLTVGDTVSNR
jgi:hypothetical protein